MLRDKFYHFISLSRSIYHFIGEAIYREAFIGEAIYLKIMIILAYIFCILYVSLIVFFVVGWQKTPIWKSVDAKKNSNKKSISVIIPVRNEAENLPKLLFSLQNQTFGDFEIVFIDDHSSDSSPEILSNFSKNRKNVRIVAAVGFGKKNALREGIDASSVTNELLICSDADCIPNKNWVETIASFYFENQVDMIIAPVVMIDNKSAFQQMQALEFLSLQAATAAAACAGVPVMCNGANMAFSRETWQMHSANLKDEKLSGDDMFLMMSVKRAKGKIAYLKSADAVVFAFPCRSWADFFNQRKRWVSKSTRYTDFFVILTAFAVFGISAMVIASAVWGILHSSWLLFAFVFLIKLLIDRILLYYYSKFAKFAKSAHLLKWLLPLSLVYPFYVVLTAIFGIFGKFVWKGRKE